ncbi:MAG: efflux transporter, family, subunit [Phenylobacterium sp.]|nr:efflux transporter, family, subunit [Phenylobacterium sp.]
MPDQPDRSRQISPRRLKIVGVVVAGLALVVIALGVISRVSADQKVGAWTNAQAIPTVKVISLNAAVGPQTLDLPGNVQAFNTAPIYARVSGYLRQWYVDIGAPVKAGQILAVIDTPDLDQQLIQAKADLQMAIANQRLSATTAHRWGGLLAQDAVSQQDADIKNGDLAAKNAMVAASRANVARLEAMETFKRITAPFDGVVTTRSTDIGDLISAGVPTATPLFTVADESRLRLYVRAPQGYSAAIQPGMIANFTVPEYPGRSFTAQLATSADAITPQSGTLLVQLQTENANRALKAGDYAQVRFSLPPNHGIIQVPATTLMFRDTGASVALVGAGGRVAMKPVTIVRDLGTTVEVASGLTPADRVIDNPPDSLRVGDQVRIAAPAVRAAGAGAHVTG